ncbi:MAG: hypothetical protein JWM95_2820 [Gemmatimonadetes bacterium]|nr:hypothetical protein [Gemmatimonadota bacterium]
MYFLILEAHPKPDHSEYGTIDGAFVSVFVDAVSAAAAERAARGLITDTGWQSDDLDEEPRWIDRAELEGNAESLERFDQASSDGIVATFHNWPVGAPDEEQG